MLYQINEELNSRITALKTETQRLKNQIDRYSEIYNLQHTENIESALERVDQALRQGFLGSLFRNEFKDFIKDYVEKSSRQINDLNRYKKSVLLQLVYTSVQQAVQSMIQDWERFFENLKDTRNSLLHELNQLSIKYESTSNPMREYVLSSKQLLEKVWGSIKKSVDQGLLPENISRQLYLSHYRQYCKRNEQSYSNYLEEIKVEELYRQNVLAHCREELMTRYTDRLDLNVIHAIRQEAMYLGIDPEAHIKNRIERIDNLTNPFIPNINKRRELKFWGIHNESYENIHEQLVNDLFEGKENPDQAFSRYEVVCYRAHYGLSVNDFSKFSSGTESETFKELPGAYYEAYRRRVDKLNQGKSTVTPHLDRRWHLPAFMPDLNPSQVELDIEKNDRAFLLGIIHGWIVLVNDSGRLVFQYHGRAGTTLILKGGLVVSEEFYSLHDALTHNPIIYEEIIERASEVREQERKKFKNVGEHQFMVGAKEIRSIAKDDITNILDAVFYYENEGPGDASLPKKGERLRKELLNEIENYYLAIYGQHRSYEARKEAATFIEELWENASYPKIVDANSSMYSSWKHLIENKKNQLMQPS